MMQDERRVILTFEASTPSLISHQRGLTGPSRLLRHLLVVVGRGAHPLLLSVGPLASHFT